MRSFFRIFVCVASVLLIASCKKKDPEMPPVKNLAAGTVYSVEQLKSIANCNNNCTRKFTNDSYLIGTALTDEISGNFYKEVYLRDKSGNGAIHLAFLSGKSGIFIGDSIRVDLNGLDVWINNTSGMLEIDSIDYEKSVTKFGTGPKPTPITIDLNSCAYAYTDYLCELVTLNGVGFIAADAGKSYADVVGQNSLNRVIQDGVGNQITVRTSNDAKFASHLTPTGFGSITGIATAYSGTNQMELRYESEVNMNGGIPSVYKNKDFQDGSLTSGGWTNVSVVNGSVNWTYSTFGTGKFAKVSGYVGGNTNAECWYISPSLDLSSSSNPVLNFKTAAKFSGNSLGVWVSTNYVSGSPSGANWTQLNGFCLSPNTSSYVWTPSGSISLSAFKTGGVRIAFKYTSTTSGATTYELDDIYIRENK